MNHCDIDSCGPKGEITPLQIFWETLKHLLPLCRHKYTSRDISKRKLLIYKDFKYEVLALWGSSCTKGSKQIDPSAKHSYTVGLVCRDNFGQVQHIDSKALGDCPILVGEVVGIREAILATIQCYHRNWFSVSDSGDYGGYYSFNLDF